MPNPHPRPKTNPIERALTPEPIEVRADENGHPILSGYAAIYDSPSVDLGGFVEVVRRGAFDDHLRTKPDVVARVQHQGGLQVIGRTTNGTLRIWSDTRGLRYEVSPPDTQAGRDIVELVRRGDIDQSSFAFTLADWEADQRWDFERQPALRELLRVQLHDVAPVSGPAYLATSVGLRAELRALYEEARAKARAADHPPYDLDAVIRACDDDLAAVRPHLVQSRTSPLVIGAPAPKKEGLNMPTLEQLHKDLEFELRSAKELAEKAQKEGLTDEAKQQIEAHRAKAEEIQAAIARREEEERLLERAVADYVALSQPRPRRGAAPEDRTDPAPEAPRSPAAPVIEYPIADVPDAFRRAMPGATREQQLRAAQKAGLYILATVGPEEGRARAMEQLRAMGTAVNASGGYITTPGELAATIIRNIVEYGIARRLLPVWPMRAGSLDVPTRAGGFTVYYPSENSDITPSDMSFGSVTLTAKKMAVLGQISRELFHEDSVIELAGLVADEIALAMAIEEDECLFVGSQGNQLGVNGIITQLEDATGGAKKGLVSAGTGHTSLDKIDARDLGKLVGTLKRYRGIRPRWFGHPEVIAQTLLPLAMGAGGATHQGDQLPTYMGYPIEYVESMDTGSGGGVVIGLGDLPYVASMGSRRDLELAQSEHIYFAKDAIAIRGTARTAMQVYGVGDASEAGGFVGLKLASA
ncbi:MAG TPA: phage major capsid protein [Arachnia sp.]|nr:phage major capsid protein [Arachnia sp.]